MRFQSGYLLVSVLAPFATAAVSQRDGHAPAHLRGRSTTYTDDGVLRNVFEHEATGAKLDFVTNSGICETTEGVNQYSGYLSVGDNQNMWFWFFESRNNASTAPLAAWFNGGPGCSSMIGLFQEHGPCLFEDGETTPSLNPYSFNEYANVLYVDQPIGVGFSYGDGSVDSTISAAPYVWKLIQAFFAQFPDYESRDFAVFTESYGGHYGPEFAHYIQTQNAAIEDGSVEGENINLVAVGINNGWFDPILQYKAYIEFSYKNSYGALLSESDYNSYLDIYTSECVPALKGCTDPDGQDSACANAESLCYQNIEAAIISSGDFDVYDIRQPSNSPYPPSTYADYLADESVVKAIGAKSTYSQCSNDVGSEFSSTGDNSRSFLDTLSTVVQSGVQVLIWAGDADWICNWFGNLDVANIIDYSGSETFATKEVTNYTVDGKAFGTFKNVDNLSWLRVFGAGHEVPYYQPEVSLQAFKQTLEKKAIFST